ncbi:Vacuolar protein-sorting-associated protein 36 [Coelomomyces lativittatus]|nr:Vacuolar protein-sorting-associated protein 36 [Coelomomyces lativittatus]
MASSELSSELHTYVFQIPCSDHSSSTPKTYGLNESLLLHLSNVGLYFNKQRMYSHDQGTLYLSTHRLIWIPHFLSNGKQQQDSSFAFDLPLISIQEIQFQKGRLRSSPKLLVQLAPLPSLFSISSWTCSTCQNVNPMSRTFPPLCLQCGMSTQVCSTCHFTNPPHSTTCQLCHASLHLFRCPHCTLDYTPSVSTTCTGCDGHVVPTAWIDFSLRGAGNGEKFYSELLNLWQTFQTQILSPEKTKLSAGVHGIVQRQQLLNDSQQLNFETAFTDLKALMTKGKEMVELANTLKTKLQDVPKDEVAQFRSTMLQLGLSTFDHTFESNLVEELTEFLKLVLPNEGLLALGDVYCMFNRAKGTGMLFSF